MPYSFSNAAPETAYFISVNGGDGTGPHVGTLDVAKARLATIPPEDSARLFYLDTFGRNVTTILCIGAREYARDYADIAALVEKAGPWCEWSGPIVEGR